MEESLTSQAQCSWKLAEALHQIPYILNTGIFLLLLLKEFVLLLLWCTNGIHPASLWKNFLDEISAFTFHFLPSQKKSPVAECSPEDIISTYIHWGVLKIKSIMRTLLVHTSSGTLGQVILLISKQHTWPLH